MRFHSSLIQLLQHLYHSGSTYLLVNGSRVPIDVKRRVRQGDVLSTKLFNATLSYAINFEDNFVFFRLKISILLSDSEEVKRKMGHSAFNKISSLLSCRLLTMKKRKILLDSCITPVALYAAETWTLKVLDQKYIEVCQRRMERRMLRITTFDRWQNERKRAITKLTNWTDTIALSNREINAASALHNNPRLESVILGLIFKKFTFV